ncbi:hypothetical protein M0805_009327 [Coniferiporia weirii]|nr:hypothetical protein M0805_009327 [Coniferiporia weirii]
MITRAALPRRHLVLLLGLALLFSLVTSPVAAAHKLSSHFPRAGRAPHRLRHHHQQRPRSPVRESRAAQPVKTRSPLNAATLNSEPRNSSLQLERRSNNARFTFYDAGLGACGKVNKPSDFIVAVNAEQWDHGSHCFETITMSYGGKKTDATIVDLCPSCPYGALDLSEGLFEYFAPPVIGIIYGSWDFGASDVSKPRAKSEKGEENGLPTKTEKTEETGKIENPRPVSKTAAPSHEHTAVRVSNTAVHSGPGKTAATFSAVSTSRKTVATSSSASASRKMVTTTSSASAPRKMATTSSSVSASRKMAATSSAASASRKTATTTSAASVSRPSLAHSTPTRHTKPTAASSMDVFGQLSLDPLPTFMAPPFGDDGDGGSEDPALETILEGITMDFGVPFPQSVTTTHSAIQGPATQVLGDSTLQDFNLAFIYLGQLIGSQTQSPEDPPSEFVARNLEPRQS